MFFLFLSGKELANMKLNKTKQSSQSIQKLNYDDPVECMEIKIIYIIIPLYRKMGYFITLQYRKMEPFIFSYEHDLIHSL